MRTFRQGAASIGAALLIVLAWPQGAAAAAPADPATLDVPYLPQTEDLCGGAAAAMLFRYWGERHASVQQFAPLIDRSAGGIADTSLIAAVRERGWTADRINGSLDALRAELQARRPPMLLIEDRPQGYHYVVAVGADAHGVLLHDPTWGPARRVSAEALLRVWKPADFWMLRVTPGATRQVESSAAVSLAVALPAGRPIRTACDEQLEATLDDIARLGMEHAETSLSALIRACPDSAGPRRELAGVRFSQRRWREAESLANEALARDPGDAYAAEVLGSSRFMRDDFDGALRAWNLTGKPVLDSVRISGLTRTRYSLLAAAIGLPSESVLTADGFRLARRRLESMPDLSSTRLALRPDDEYAIADVSVVERATLPHGAVQWVAAGAQAALEREVSVNLPGRTGQGETWSAAGGWWENRPRVSLDFASPLTSGVRGVWRVGTAWAVQSYGAPDAPGASREERLGGSISLSTWILPNLRVTAASGLDRWTMNATDSWRTLHATGTLEERLLDDRVAASLTVARWFGLGSSRGFTTAALQVSGRTSREPRPLVVLARVGGHVATRQAPFGAWSGAGEGRSRGPLLRAHRLLHDGRIDGPVFGRRLAYATVEAQHWTAKPRLVRLALAAFADAAGAAHRPVFSSGAPAQVDVGGGLRVRVPGRAGAFRVDYARGLRDGANAWFLGWQLE